MYHSSNYSSGADKTPRQLPLPWPSLVDGWPRNNAELLVMLIEVGRERRHQRGASGSGGEAG